MKPNTGNGEENAIQKQELHTLLGNNKSVGGKRNYEEKMLWEKWRRRYTSDEEALVKAIWYGNKLVKMSPLSPMDRFYALKDAFLNRYTNHLVEGRISRQERFGLLYEHHLLVCGEKYCFHSYTKPDSLSNTPGADVAQYGRPLSDEEINELQFVLSEIILAIEWAIFPEKVINRSKSRQHASKMKAIKKAARAEIDSNPPERLRKLLAKQENDRRQATAELGVENKLIQDRLRQRRSAIDRCRYRATKKLVKAMISGNAD